MKNIIYLLIFVFPFLMGGCSSKKDIIEPIKPTHIISESEAQEITGCDNLKLEYGAVVDMGENTYKASYLSEPLGEADPVIVTIIYPSETITETDIKEIYEKGYDSRHSKRRIEGIGDRAYVSFPAINILMGGHLIKITAGSGETKEQLETLINLGKRAVNNFELYYN